MYEFPPNMAENLLLVLWMYGGICAVISIYATITKKTFDETAILCLVSGFIIWFFGILWATRVPVWVALVITALLTAPTMFMLGGGFQYYRMAFKFIKRSVPKLVTRLTQRRDIDKRQ